MKYFSFSKLEVVSFVTGFCLLAYELAAARILAPSIGSSTYVWTSVIGTIIAALSVGYFVGGKLADRRNREIDVAWLLLFSGLAAMFSLMMYLDVLRWLTDTQLDTRLQAVIAALLLFAPASFVMGAISPYLAKLNVRSLLTSGSAVASLSALNSIGGIVGTFVTGFILFGYVGSRETVVAIIVLLLLTSWLMVPRSDIKRRAIVSGALIFLLALPQPISNAVASIDTPSARYDIYDFFYEGVPARGLVTGPSGTQSAVYLNGSPDLVFWYTREMAVQTIKRKPERVLMLGGGAFTLPQYLAGELPDTQIDVVEIDPELERISKEYFYYQDPDNVNLYFTDARTFVNEERKPYDVILVDVYGDGTIPATLITKEFAVNLKRITAEGGLVLANVIGGERGVCKETFDAVLNAYDSQFGTIAITNESNKKEDRANYIAAISNNVAKAPSEYRAYQASGPLYTDNFSPADRLYYQCYQSSKNS